MNLLKSQSVLPSDPSSSNNLGSTDLSRRVFLPASSRRIYWNLVGNIKKKPTAESKYEDLFSMHSLQWEQVYLLPRIATLVSKTREFQYKLLHKLYKQTRVSLKWVWCRHLCAPFVKKLEESLEHLFIYRDTSKDFWFSVIEWLKEHSFGVNHLSALDITFGFISKDNLLLNHIIILGKQVIYQSCSLNIKPTLMLLKAKIRSTNLIESFIAEKNEDLQIQNMLMTGPLKRTSLDRCYMIDDGYYLFLSE